MPRRLLASLAAILTGSLLVAACSSSSSSPAAPTVVPTSAAASAVPEVPADGVIAITNADVPMPAPQPAPASGSPLRIVSLATGVGETLAALGVASQVVGRDETSDVPLIDAAPVMTKAHAISAERVLATDPDVVLIDASSSPPEAIDQLRSAGVRVVAVPEAWTLADIAPRTRAVAAAVGVDAAAADAVVAEATGTAPSRAASAGARPRVAFLYLRGTSAIYLVGGEGSGADALIAAAGAIDVGAEAGMDAFVPMTAEAVATLDPDVLLVMTKGLESVGGVDGLVGLPGVAQTRAGRERRVVAVDDTLLLSFGPRTGALVNDLAVAIDRAAA